MSYTSDTKNKKKQKNKVVNVGIAHICATFNNTSITISDTKGAVIAWEAAGKNFKGSKKATPYAARIVAESVAEKVQKYGLKTISIRLKGPGAGRESAVTAIASKFTVTSIAEVTPIPHNGCRPPKKRRV